MARNDGVDRTSVRNLVVSDKAVGNTQQHNEREKDGYRNPDIIPQRAAWNVHFKKPTASYTDLFSQLETAGTISTRGLKPDATHYCELVFAVNSAYFDNHGGYEFAKQFYEDAYHCLLYTSSLVVVEAVHTICFASSEKNRWKKSRTHQMMPRCRMMQQSAPITSNT